MRSRNKSKYILCTIASVLLGSQIAAGQIPRRSGFFDLSDFQYRDTETLRASEEVARFAKKYQPIQAQNAYKLKHYNYGRNNKAPVFYGKGHVVHPVEKDPREIFDFRDSRYIKPLPENRINKPITEVEAERLELNAAPFDPVGPTSPYSTAYGSHESHGSFFSSGYSPTVTKLFGSLAKTNAFGVTPSPLALDLLGHNPNHLEEHLDVSHEFQHGSPYDHDLPESGPFYAPEADAVPISVTAAPYRPGPSYPTTQAPRTRYRYDPTPTPTSAFDHPHHHSEEYGSFFSTPRPRAAGDYSGEAPTRAYSYVDSFQTKDEDLTSFRFDSDFFKEFRF